MENKRKSNKYSQVILIVFVWVLLIAAPLFFRQERSIETQQISNLAKTIVPLFVIFLINRFLLVPHLLFKKKNISYFLSVAILVGAITLILFAFDGQKHLPQGGPPPIGLEHDSQFPGQMPPHMGPQPAPNRGERPMPPFLNLLIFSILLVGFDTGLMSAFKLEKAEKDRANLEKQNTETQLAFLKNQISPHFFMNTLNNIHALIDIDHARAQDAIIQLSRLMSYMLYESEAQKVALSKEIEVLKSYIELMKMRIKNVDLQLKLPDLLPKVNIAPLLSIAFIENAFKYGISNSKPSFIHITIDADDHLFRFYATNSVHKKDDKKEGGIGIENTKKRLDLIYENNYKLDIRENDTTFEVDLKINL